MWNTPLYSMAPSTLNRSGHAQTQSAVAQVDETETKGMAYKKYGMGRSAIPYTILQLAFYSAAKVTLNLVSLP